MDRPALNTNAEDDNPTSPNEIKTGLDLRVGLSLPFAFGNAYNLSQNKVKFRSIGTLADIEFGYRFKYLGLYLQQSLGGFIYTGDEYAYLFSGITNAEFATHVESSNSSFEGMTLFVARGFIPLEIRSTQNALVSSVGIGVAYAGDITGTRKISIPLTFRVGLGFEHYFNTNNSVGVYLDYYLYRLLGKVNDKDTAVLIHHFAPTINLGYTF